MNFRDAMSVLLRNRAGAKPHRFGIAWPVASSSGKHLLAAAMLGLLAAFFGGVPASIGTAQPPYEIQQTPPLRYVQKGTWFDSMLASRAALQADEDAGRRPLPRVSFHSDVIRGRQPAQAVSVRLEGVREIYLYVTGAPDVVYGAGDWIAPRAVDADGGETLLCSSKYLNIQQGFHTVDCSLRSRVDPPLRVADRTCAHGINVQAPGKIRVRLPAGTQRFETEIGIDDWVNPETYRLPQPYYYQPQHFSTAALRNRSSATDVPAQPHGAVRFHVTDAAGAARMDLWTRLALDFATELPRQQMKWAREDRLLEEDWNPGDWQTLARRYAAAADRVPGLRTEALRLAGSVADRESFERIRAIYHRSRQLAAAVKRAEQLNFVAVDDAVHDLMADFGDAYENGATYLAQLRQLETSLTAALRDYRKKSHTTASENAACTQAAQRVLDLLAQFDRLRDTALTANPLLNWDRLLLIRRTPHGDPRRAIGRGYGVAEYLGYPRQSSKCNPGIEQPLNWDNDLCVLSPVRHNGQIKTLYDPQQRRLLKDIDLNWSADRILFSMPGSFDKWQVFEINTDGTHLHQMTPTDQPDVHFYDACYLPSGEIALVSTAPMQGVPCNTGVIVGMMFKMNADGTGIRQIAFEQDHTYCPNVTEDGRILYLRWDYTDTPHVWNRVLFTMNPDGTGQSEFYGSNSYWPNSLFFARPIPNHATQFVGIVTGHHVGRAGELILFDRSKGGAETDGVVQRIGDRHAHVMPTIEDKLTQHSWPKFLNPYPLSDKYFLVSCKPTPDALWGIYLADVFDNLVLLKEEEGRALLEPIPLRQRSRPPVIPDRTRPQSDNGTLYIADIYAGPGLHGIPRGTVKKLRLYTYHFAYQKQAGIQHRVGSDGPWEIKRVLGTVPVEPDGSALFHVPAKTPISLQPLDEQGKALQLMRSWLTVMPGERRSCVGCHENSATAPPSLIGSTFAERKPAESITPWYGATRGFSFSQEVQPVLDKYCVGCHDGSMSHDGTAPPDLRAHQNFVWAYKHGQPDLIRIEGTPIKELTSKYSGLFPPSYIALRKQVRVGGLETDLHLLPPMEFYADTSRLVRMLKKGHHGVQLNSEAWDRLVTWIDLNAPCHGTWSEFTRIPGNQENRRCQLRALYGGKLEDGEEVVHGDPPFGGDLTPIMPQTSGGKSTSAGHSHPNAFVSAAAHAEITDTETADNGTEDNLSGINLHSLGNAQYMTLDLGRSVSMRLVKIPAGRAVGRVSIAHPVWMGCCEVTNRQYAQVDPKHDSRFEHRGSWIFSEEYLGWPLDAPDQPVVRVSWEEANAFCRSLSRRTARQIRLPSEQEWEYACRAGTATPFWFGDTETDFSAYANLGDRSLRRLATESWGPRPPDVVARDDRFDDRFLVTAPVGSFAPNPFGLFDMIGNAAEWTSSRYDDRSTTRAVRGGSWRDLPADAASAERFGYQPYEKVFNVGFRVVCEVAQGARP